MSFSVHPLFFLFGLYFAATGKVFSFIAFTLCALIHETGHAAAAQRLGYKLKKITLMPYGAIISGDISGISYINEIKVVCAGPLINLASGLAIIALWWLFPEIYPYTELAATANFSLFFVNLIPAYPLDGGRLLLCTLSCFLSRKKAALITKATGIFFSVCLLALFIYSCFLKVNFSILFFAAFVFCGVTDKNPENGYIRFYESQSVKNLTRPKVIKELAVKDTFTVKNFYKISDGSSLYRVFVYSENGELLKVLNPDYICDALSRKGLNSPLLELPCVENNGGNGGDYFGDGKGYPTVVKTYKREEIKQRYKPEDLTK